jgi:hypothetical protein
MNKKNDGKCGDLMSHTPGPWEIDNCGTHIEIHDSEMNICVIDVNSRPSTEREDNARLIAAAPDLLKAAEKIIPALQPPTNHEKIEKAFFDLSKAIKKARGKS